MSLPVLTAMTDPRWEAGVVEGLAGGGHGIEVVRRCVDLADLLAAGAAGLARAALVSADLRQLDRDALARLSGAGVAVVGLVAPDDEAAERRLRQLGVGVVVPADADPATVSTAVRVAVGERAYLPPDNLLDGLVTAAGAADGTPLTPPDDPPPGRIFALWGATGAPGRSTLATSLAFALAPLRPTLLVDADVYGASVGQLLGVLDEAPGLAAACRLANNGTLDLPALDELALQVAPGLRVLTGIARAQRWPELRPSALDVVLELARQLCAVVVIDCSFCLEQDEELSYDTAAPRRNGATLAVLAAADVIVGVAAADPIGIQRYVRGLSDLREVLPSAEVVTVVNRMRRGPTGPGDPRREIAAALDRYAGIEARWFVPEDRAGVDAALAAGKALPEAAPNSPATGAVRQLAAHLAGVPSAAAGRRRRRQGLLR